jgi:hypothetical protein
MSFEVITIPILIPKQKNIRKHILKMPLHTRVFMKERLY